MARKKRSVQLRPQLTRFYLLSLAAVNKLSVSGGAGRINLRRKQDIEIETMPPEGERKLCRVLVRLNMVVKGYREGDETPVVALKGKYEGRFLFSPDIDIGTIDAAASTEEFQYALTSQVYPLAMNHLKEQLELMGMTSQRMPLGV